MQFKILIGIIPYLQIYKKYIKNIIYIMRFNEINIHFVLK